MVRAEPQFEHLRDFWPAATGDDAVIDFNRAPRGFRRSGRQHRDGRFRHVHRARRLIESLSEPALVDVSHERIEGPIVGPDRTKAGGKGGNSGEVAQRHAPGKSGRTRRTRRIIASKHERLFARAIRLKSANPQTAPSITAPPRRAQTVRAKRPRLGRGLVVPSRFAGAYSR